MGGIRELPREVKILTAVAFTVAVGFGIQSPAIPVFASEFGVGSAAVGAVVSAFAFMRLATGLPGGRLVNRFGERAVLATGMTLLAVTSVLAGLSWNYPQLLIFRGACGIGSALYTVSAMNLLLRVTPASHRGRAAVQHAGTARRLHRAADIGGARPEAPALPGGADHELRSRLGGLRGTGRRPSLLGEGLVLGSLVVVTAWQTLPGYLAAFALMGLGTAFCTTGGAATVGDVTQGRGGTAVAAYQMTADLGMTVGPLVAGQLASYSYETAFVTTAVVVLAGLMMAVAMPSRRNPPDPA
ncbi:MFS transporter [Sphaerisporangium viridialbum]|uniref:MFS transporter n=1 Tax=Sphaerisporangium viridialbum TaxID=46189 RepID=UPI003C731C9F